MRVPLHWLRELVDVDVPTQEVAERLSHTGSAVDAIDRFAPGVSGIVVGRVLEVSDVPETKLVISRVDIGSEVPTILAGAKNFGVGDLVPVATVGALVVGLDVPIARRKMLGRYESQGMLCSAKELGVDGDHAGILVLHGDFTVGEDVAAKLGLDDDVFEFEIYPNRPDQMSVLGIAREVAVLYGTELRYPDVGVVEDGERASSRTSVTIDDPVGCPRYLARVIEGTTFASSPALVRARLSACGVRPLGNLIDATNYVLLLTGQPLHAFDLDKLAEERIVVRRARVGEQLATLDEQTRTLSAEDLVIADANDAQALAGIIGGAGSEVGPATTRVLLESAYFDPITIARTSRNHHVRTEASARFERGADAEMVPKAAAIAAECIRRWAGGTVSKGAVDAGAAPERRTLTLRPERVDAILGITVENDEVRGLLTGLGCEVRDWGGRFDVVAPSWRPDLEREVDLVEEIARLHGYGTIPAKLAHGIRGGRTPAQVLRERVRQTLLGAGLTEATLPTFIAEDDARLFWDGPLVRVSNPMTADQGQLRPSLFPGLLRAAQRNVSRGASRVRLFEFGKIFRGWSTGDPLPDETEHVAFVVVGDDGPEHYSVRPRPADAYDAKGIIELVLEELGLRGWEFDTSDVAPFFHPGRAASILIDGTIVGRFGELRPSIGRRFDLDGGAVVGGLSLAPLFACAPERLGVTELAAQPPVLRDIAIAVDEEVTAGELIDTISRRGQPLLESVVLVDVYRGDQVGAGRKSLAFRLTFRAPDRTLLADEADGTRLAIVDALRADHGADVR